MGKKKKLESDKENLLDVVFGSDIDMDKETEDAILEMYNIDTSELLSNFKKRLKDKAGEQRFNGGVNKLTASALDNLSSKPVDNTSSSEQYSPKTYLDMFLGGELLSNGETNFAYSFRATDKNSLQPDKDLVQSDKELLEGLKAKLPREEDK